MADHRTLVSMGRSISAGHTTNKCVLLNILYVSGEGHHSNDLFMDYKFHFLSLTESIQ